MLMSPETTPVMMLVTLASGVVVFILVIFLPAVFKSTNPKDSGSREVTHELFDSVFQTKLVSLENCEETRPDRTLVEKLATVLSVLPDLES